MDIYCSITWQHLISLISTKLFLLQTKWALSNQLPNLLHRACDPNKQRLFGTLKILEYGFLWYTSVLNRVELKTIVNCTNKAKLSVLNQLKKRGRFYECLTVCICTKACVHRTFRQLLSDFKYILFIWKGTLLRLVSQSLSQDLIMGSYGYWGNAQILTINLYTVPWFICQLLSDF